MAGITTRVEAEGTGLRLTWTLGGLPRLFRYLFGGGAFAIGLFFLATLVANGFIIARGAGNDLIAGTILSVLLAAVFLPMGWRLLVARVSLMVRKEQVIERTDWRIGRKERTRDPADYRAVGLSVEPVSGKESDKGKAMGIRIALLPESPRHTPVCELAWFEAEEDRIGEARDLARRIASLLERPVEDALDEWFGGDMRRSD
jgi:hypothetical protein